MVPVRGADPRICHGTVHDPGGRSAAASLLVWGAAPGMACGWGVTLAMPRGPGMRELGAEEHDQGRVIDPHQEHHQRARRAVGRAHARLAEVKADGGLAEGKERPP